MANREVEKIEMELLLEGILKMYGYDFRDYAPASLKRRLRINMARNQSKTFLSLLQEVLYNKKAFEDLLCDLSVSVTEMFRDPQIYKAFLLHVVPILKTYPFIKIWHAGCATGEEVYSMAILLHETNLLARTQIYATDINLQSLEIAKEGIYPYEQIIRYNTNYQMAGGTKSFSDYYDAKYGSVMMSDFLKKKITFAYHNLAVDHSFCEAQLIVCRNVLIYFNSTLQDRVIKLINDSLSNGGFLLLGSKESLNFSEYKNSFECVSRKDKLYRKSYNIEEANHE